MAKGFNGELLHFTAVRMRVIGSGILLPTLYSLNDISSSILETLTMSVTTDIEPTKLALFVSQRGYLKLATENSGEYFNISKISIFVKPISTGLPQ